MYQPTENFNFGMYQGMPIWTVALCDPSYIKWCIKTVESFAIDGFDELRQLPLFDVDRADSFEGTCLLSKLHAEMDKEPARYKCSLPGSFEMTAYLKDKGYEFYLEFFKPYMIRRYEYDESIIELNESRLKAQKNRNASQDLPYDTWEPSEKYTFDDTINDAFEGDSSNYWNID
ncbi:hypothetical protein [Hymenobacter negativus]|uniref:Uncharacterized protein n=1 Tax=Hymenobacter negativus TaxID=2795026 RepID=A0ABS3QK84_9BACT|nr:hypothetical protein [Hymenobacter negativus]MBO2011496.1 hypothetical protein [Hymenobacter negativus]